MITITKKLKKSTQNYSYVQDSSMIFRYIINNKLTPLLYNRKG
jgi:hypothetical protein